MDPGGDDMETGSAVTRIPRRALEAFTRSILEAVGLATEHADVVATSLVDGDARGLPSHGVVRLLPVYVNRLQKNSMNRNPEVKVTASRGATSHIDGDGGPGQVAARFAMCEAIKAARQFGVGVSLVRNSSHYGVGSAYVEQATREGMAGIALTNAPPNMPPAGGRAKFFGTNPITIGVPYRDDFPVMLDMSTSVVARGKIAIAEREGDRIPEGWAIDAEGNPTTDPAAALKGSVLPMAGYKGAGLALMIDILAGVLSGAAYGTHIVDLYDQGHEHQDVGHFLLAIDVGHFLPVEAFRTRMEAFVTDVTTQPRMPGIQRIYVPGEIEYEAAREADEVGIRLSAAGLADLKALAKSVGVSPPAI